jgi:hypothetical protein
VNHERELLPTFGNPVMEALAQHGIDYWDLALFGLSSTDAFTLYFGDKETIPPQLARFLTRRGHDAGALAAEYLAWADSRERNRRSRRHTRQSKPTPATAVQIALG